MKNFAPMIWPWRRSSARPWHGLAPVCQKWWHVISMSPCRLDPWILFKFGAPIGNILCSWPTLEIELHGVGLQFSAIRQVLLSANNVIGLRFPMSRIPSIFHQKTSFVHLVLALAQIAYCWLPFPFFFPTATCNTCAKAS